MSTANVIVEIRGPEATPKPSIEETICRELHPMEWRAAAPRSKPCADCMRVGLAIRLTHGAGA